jgi:CheY-like chemotaxis protein
MDRDKRPFDLMIAANDLPRIPGFTVLVGLRARNWTTPFILMTHDTTVQARAQRLGAVVLDRPSNVPAIRSAVLEAYALPGAKVDGLPEIGVGLEVPLNRLLKKPL